MKDCNHLSKNKMKNFIIELYIVVGKFSFFYFLDPFNMTTQYKIVLFYFHLLSNNLFYIVLYRLHQRRARYIYIKKNWY